MVLNIFRWKKSSLSFYILKYLVISGREKTFMLQEAVVIPLLANVRLWLQSLHDVIRFDTDWKSQLIGLSC